MIILEHIKVFFPDKTLFDDLNWQINSGSRIGLIGDNGVGKTTLFKILVGQHEPDEGKVILPDNYDIGYLPQDLILLNDYLLKDYLQEAAGIIQLKNKMKQYQQELSEVNSENLEFERIARRYEKTSHQFGIKGGYSFEARAKSIIKGLGFTDQDWIKPCSYFSGGWKMRVVLAGLLVSSPDILLLDEPTNHMDTESLEWLESWLKDYNGILLIISHDRYFLDKVVKETVELANRKIIVYKGNYSFYLTEKNKREELQEKHQKHLQEKKEHLETFIERFRYKATKASQVQSRIKMLEKLEPEIKQEKANSVSFSFVPAPRSAEEVVRIENVSHRYGEKLVFHDLNFTINRGERVALTGVNGAGKSTLSRIISGIESPIEGMVNWGHKVKIAYFLQESAQNLNYMHSVWEEIDKNNNRLNDQGKRNLLGSFLFTGDSIYKIVNQLSGGEKSRLALAKLLLEESNFLILDEPGNHLDIKTKEIFYQALIKYQGTILIVSHDRFFLDQLANRIIEIKEGKIYNYPGNYSYFIQKRQILIKEENESKLNVSESREELNPRLIDKQKKRAEAEQRNIRYQLRKKIEEKIHPLEKKIHILDEKKSLIEKKLCQKEILQSSEKVQELKIELHHTNNALNKLMEQWEILISQKEEIENITPGG